MQVACALAAARMLFACVPRNGTPMHEHATLRAATPHMLPARATHSSLHAPPPLRPRSDSHTKQTFRSLQCLLIDFWPQQQVCKASDDANLEAQLNNLPTRPGEVRCFNILGDGRICQIHNVLATSLLDNNEVRGRTRGRGAAGRRGRREPAGPRRLRAAPPAAESPPCGAMRAPRCLHGATDRPTAPSNLPGSPPAQVAFGGVLPMLRQKFASPNDIFVIQTGAWHNKLGPPGLAQMRVALQKLGEDYAVCGCGFVWVGGCVRFARGRHRPRGIGQACHFPHLIAPATHTHPHPTYPLTRPPSYQPLPQRNKGQWPYMLFRESPMTHDKDTTKKICLPAPTGARCRAPAQAAERQLAQAAACAAAQFGERRRSVRRGQMRQRGLLHAAVQGA